MTAPEAVTLEARYGPCGTLAPPVAYRVTKHGGAVVFESPDYPAALAVFGRWTREDGA